MFRLFRWALLEASIACSLVSSPSIWASSRHEFSQSTYVVKPTRLWTEPSKFGEPIAALDPGLEVKILSFTTTDSWVLVRTPAGREGWVPVRFTALSGRRDKPVLSNGNNPPGERDEASNARRGERSPASIAGAPSSQAVAGHGFGNSSDWIFSGELSYQNLLSRDQLSGLGLGAGVETRFGSHWDLGFALDFAFYAQNLSSVDGSVHTSVKRLFPYALAKYVRSSWELLVGVGADIDSTSFTTRDIYGNVIYDSGVGAVTGSETNFALGVKLRPTYKFPMGPDSALGLFLYYYASIDVSGGSGRFAGPSVGAVTHTLGAGLSYQLGF
jgi:hypothetical protein